MPEDYEECGYCGFDHGYEPEQAYQWHRKNPCSYCFFNDGQHEVDCPIAIHARKEGGYDQD